MPSLTSFFGGILGSAANQAGSNLLTNPVNFLTNSIAPTGILPANETMLLRQLGWIDDTNFERQMRCHGYVMDYWNHQQFRSTLLDINGMGRINNNNLAGVSPLWNRYKQLDKPWPSNAELNVMFNRGLIDADLYDFIAKIINLNEPALINANQSLRFEIPGPSDLVRFAVRDCFSPAIVEKFEYAQETPRAIQPWMIKQGFGGNVGVNKPGNATWDNDQPAFGPATWFDLFWWSHWELPSVGQGYDMLFKLYPESRYGSSPLVTGKNEFRVEDLRLLQKANDYPEFWRSRLEAIAYQPLTRVDVRRMRAFGVISKADVYHSYRHQGYTDENANRLTEFTELLSTGINPIKESQISLKELDSLYLEGIVNKPDIEDFFQNKGFPSNYGTQHAEKLEVLIKRDSIKKQTKLIKRGYLDGLLSDTQVSVALSNLGLSNDRKTLLYNEWSLEKLVVRKYLSADKAIDLYKRGLINEAQLTTKLSNLGYIPVEISYLIIAAKQDVIKAIGKEEQKKAIEDKRTAEKIAKEKQKAINDALKEQQKQFDKDLKGILNAYSDKNLIAFYSQGLISRDDVQYVLNLRHWPVKAVEAWLVANIDPIEITQTQG